MKPRIGITTFLENRGRKTYSSVSYNYINSVLLAGGIPVPIPIIEDKNNLKQYADIIDGIIFTGGEDVTPFYYNENPTQHINFTSPERDEQEVELLQEVLRKNIPVLGICRGIQIINVAFGGTLYQDINSQVVGSLGHSPSELPVHNLYHNINIQQDSRLYDIFGVENLKVNSFHHQSVKDLGKGLKICALSADGIIEAVESTEEDFLMAVQFHPEDLTVKHPHFLKLFKTLIKEAGK